MSSAKRKAEDSADGCRALERDDRKRAAASSSEHMRAVLERSADAWSERARLLDRLEKDFNAPMLQDSRDAEAGRPKIMAKGQKRSNKEVRKPKAKVPKKTNASQLSKKTMGIRTA